MKKCTNKIIYLILTNLIILTSLNSQNMKPAKQITLPSIFSNNMVLQRNVPIKIWGKAEPLSQIKIQIDDKNDVVVNSNNKGKWNVELKAMQAGGPHTLKIMGVDTILFPDVMIGEVWLCSGQSNMEFAVNGVLNRQYEIDNADYKNIRLFTVDKKVSVKTLEDCEGVWDKCSPETVADFSGVGYFFGRELYEKLKVPIGLIHSSWGGTPIEAWMNYKTLQSDSDFIPIINRFNESIKDYPQKLKKYKEIIQKIKEKGTELNQFQIDTENKGLKLGYSNYNFDDTNWGTMKLPRYWEGMENMDIDGAVWFRKKIEIPNSWLGEKLIIELGSIDDFDTTYVNGFQIGSIGEETPNYWTHYRKYIIPENINNTDTLVIAVRVFDHFGSGGFGGPRRKMKVYKESNPDDFISLSGSWKYKIETKLSPLDITGPGGNGFPPKPLGPESSHRLAGLYNGMIFPLAPFTIRGAIWYQGETNAGRAYQYRKLLPAMIKDWRSLWKNPNLFFGIVSLANYMNVEKEPTESSWAELREAQAITVANDKNTSLALAIDIGEAGNIHPKNKQEVGRRLALGALVKVYGKNMVYSGPWYNSHKVEGNKFVITFNHIGSGLIVKDSDMLKGFSIAGKDKKFVWAKAKIAGKNKVEVWSDEISNPVAVRYAWADNPVCNLYNKEGLPAVPFRTDNWKGITFNKK